MKMYVSVVGILVCSTVKNKGYNMALRMFG